MNEGEGGQENRGEDPLVAEKVRDGGHHGDQGGGFQEAVGEGVVGEAAEKDVAEGEERGGGEQV